MLERELRTLTNGLLWGAYGLSAAFGAMVRRSHFCTLGANADAVSIGDRTRLRLWLLAIAVAILGFNCLVGAGWVQARDSV
jgi:hypothetical protein